MGEIKIPTLAKLFVGMISNEEPIFDKAKERLVDLYGPVDLESIIYPWEHTTYYEKEMGKNLKRRFLFFQDLIQQDRLAEVKAATVEIESSFARKDGKRRINLDPGYITAAKVVLASTKDFSHRLYLGQGIYGEVTLQYKEKTFHPLPHTFPDYQTKEYIELFNSVRERL